MRHMVMCVGLAWGVSAAAPLWADGLVRRLPQDGTWVRYTVTVLDQEGEFGGHMEIHSAVNLLTPLSVDLVAAFAALALVAFLFIRWAAGPPMAVARRWALFVLRALVVLTLLAILLNPVQVHEWPGSIKRPEVIYLLDASQSMALGEGGSRWDEAIRRIREAEKLMPADAPAHIQTFRFGSRLAAVESPFSRPADPPTAHANPAGAAVAAPPPTTRRSPLTPTDPDTQLLAALRQLPGRFGRTAPAGVVVFSDGQSRDAGEVEQVAGRYARMRVPVHVVPVGNSGRLGDVAVVSVVAPARVRKHAQVPVQVFVRSYGFDGKRSELKLTALGDDHRTLRELNRTPVSLKSGIQSFNLVFESDMDIRHIQAEIDAQPDEVSTDNNKFSTEVVVDRTKIRVLYVEGAVGTRLFQVQGGQVSEARAEYSDLREALTHDPDIECVVILSMGGGIQLQRVNDNSNRGFPLTPAELFAFDAIVLSDVARNTLGDKELAWLDEWIGRRGGGLCMVGGPRSFSSGGWRVSPVADMLPVEMAQGTDWSLTSVPVRPETSGPLHAIWHIVADDKQNRTLLGSFPAFSAANQVGQPKPGATVLATTTAFRSQDGPMPAIAVQPYGRGRTMAVATGITERYSPDFVRRWGEGDNRYYAKFWRNVIYWLTENSSIGRRRLIADTEKRLYRPGETISIDAEAYDESSKRTLDYRVAVMIEPIAGTDPSSLYSPVRWPSGPARTSGEQGPTVAWGEEFEMPKNADKNGFSIRLPLAEATAPVELGSGAGAATSSAGADGTADAPDSAPASSATSPVQSLRIELTAYEDNTQVDSTSLDIQILHDPVEQQNPMPNHELLKRIASLSGGKVLSDSASLASTVTDLPVKVGPPLVRRMPLWSQWWLLGFLVLLLTVEWIWRRSLGLA